MSHKQYDPALIDWMRRQIEREGKRPADLIDSDLSWPAGHRLELPEVLEVVRSAAARGWDALVAAPAEEPESEGAVQDEPAEPRRMKEGAGIARGQKRPNTKSNKLSNAAKRKAAGRRGGVPGQNARRLVFNTQAQDPEFEYRWVLDRDGRVMTLERQDWDVVSDSDHHVREGQGGTVDVPAGNNAYSAGKMVLMRKVKEWYADDQIKKDGGAQEFEAQINGQKPMRPSALNGGSAELQQAAADAGVHASNFYVPPGEVNSVGREG